MSLNLKKNKMKMHHMINISNVWKARRCHV